MRDFIRSIKFSNFLGLWTITMLLAMYFFAILLPEKFANSPIVTQFTTMAGTVITLIVGYYFGSSSKENKKTEHGTPGTLHVPEQEIETEKPKEDKPMGCWYLDPLPKDSSASYHSDER